MGCGQQYGAVGLSVLLGGGCLFLAAAAQGSPTAMIPPRYGRGHTQGAPGSALWQRGSG